MMEGNYTSIIDEIDQLIQKRNLINERISELTARISPRSEDRLRISRTAIQNPNRIIIDACTYYNMSYESITGKSRVRELVDRRFVIMSIMRHVCGCGLTEIGRSLNKTHATILHGIKMFNILKSQIGYEWMQEDFNIIVDRLLIKYSKS